MGAFQCPRCKQQRSQNRYSLCPVCWLLDDLMLEHEEGKHKAKLNVSCEACHPEHFRRMRESAAGSYVRRLLSARPLNLALARFLLKLDQLGVVHAAAKGERGNKALLWLREHGHLTIVNHDVQVSAQSRYRALQMIADTQRRTNDTPARQNRFETTSHAQCTHERTPRARAQCRTERKANG